jgi:hypothetical protein
VSEGCDKKFSEASQVAANDLDVSLRSLGQTRLQKNISQFSWHKSNTVYLTDLPLLSDPYTVLSGI